MTNKGGFLINPNQNLNFECSYQKSGTNKGGFLINRGFLNNNITDPFVEICKAIFNLLFGSFEHFWAGKAYEQD